jgi:hypothetical protein
MKLNARQRHRGKSGQRYKLHQREAKPLLHNLTSGYSLEFHHMLEKNQQKEAANNRPIYKQLYAFAV